MATPALPHRRFPLRSLLFTAYTAGCTSWHTERVTPEEVISQKAPAKIRLTVADSNVVMYQPRLLHDSLSGFTFVPVDLTSSAQVPGPKTSIDRIAFAVPISDVHRVQTRGVSVVRTLGLAGSLVLLGMAMTAAAAGSLLGSEGHPIQ